MGDIIGMLAVVFIFGGGSLFLLAISPVGRAIATRIQGQGAVAEDTVERLEAAQQAVLDELDALRRDVVDMQERLDFTERVLAQQRHQAALPGAEGSSPPSA